MEVYFLSGASGTWKTTFAKYVCEKNGWHYYISSSSNDPLDDYMGEEVIILDEINPRDYESSFLLKILNSSVGTIIKSRYRNKIIECKVIFLTTVIPIEEFYKSFSLREQLMQCCENYLVFENDIIKLYKYDYTLGKYVGGYVCKNPCAKMYPKKAVTEEDFDITAEFLGLTDQVK